MFYTTDVDVSIDNTTFSHNNATGEGGAIRCWRTSKFNMLNVDFLNNSAPAGGALFMRAAPSFAFSYDGGLVEYNTGGGVFIDSDDAGVLGPVQSVSLKGVTWRDNVVAHGDGGGFGLSADSLEAQVSVLVDECAFFRNRGRYGMCLNAY